MAIKLGGGGGANIPYKGSTAEVTYLPVAQGSYQNLDAAGKIIPTKGFIAETNYFSQTALALASASFGYYRTNTPFAGGRSEGVMPNGKSLVTSFGYTGSTSGTAALIYVLDTDGSLLTYSNPFGTNNQHYSYNSWSTQYLGEDSQYYLFSCFIQGTISGSSGYQRSLLVKVNKVTNAIGVNQTTSNSLGSGTLAGRSDDSAPRLFTARNQAVWCAEYVSTSASTTNVTITVSSGTVNTNFVSASAGTTTTFTSIYSATNVSLTKYDDGSGNFLLMYCTGTGSLVFKKILVAADGTHTVTDLSVSGLSLGTTVATQIHAQRCVLQESEVLGKYLLFSNPYIYQANYQKISYNGTAVTAGGFQKYNTATTNAADYFFRYSGSSTPGLRAAGQIFYQYAEDAVYVAPIGTHANWSSYVTGAKWILGSGDVSDTAVTTTVFNEVARPGDTSESLLSRASNGIISSKINYNNASSAYIKAASDRIFYPLGITKEQVAYVRQAGDVGDTVNISLVEGITSSDTLSSTYFLNKEDFYYALSSITGSGASVIKSIQRGTNYFGADNSITIATVDVNKSFINYHSWANANYQPSTGQLTLTNSTTLTYDWVASANYVQWEVIEYV